MGAQGLRCLNRYPSVLAGLAVAKTKTHHRDSTGCWGREISKAGIRKRRGKGRSEGRKRRRERKGRMRQGQRKDGGGRGESREKGKRKQKNCKARKHLEKRGRKKRRRPPTQPFPSASPFPVVQERNGRKVLATARAVAVGQVSVCNLGPDLSWAWEAKQPWGQETSLRKGEGSGPCKVGGVRVCAPPLLAPKFSPDGPYATVPVLGCSFPEESYPSLANQPSSGAKQGDVRCASEGGAVPPRGSVLSPW